MSVRSFTVASAPPLFMAQYQRTLLLLAALAGLLLLSLTLSTLGGRSSTDTNLVFAGTVLAMTPPILVFLFAQRYFVEISASSGLK